MKDKVELIKAKVEEKINLYERLLNAGKGGGAGLMSKIVALQGVLIDINFIQIDSLPEEPVSEVLCAADSNSYKYIESVRGAAIRAFVDGANWKKTHLWKPANGDDLPEIDREVVVFTQNFPDDAEIMCVAIAHRPNPDGWDGKSLSTGKVEHYTPKTYGKGGWNIPDVKFWLDCLIPEEIEL